MVKLMWERGLMANNEHIVFHEFKVLDDVLLHHHFSLPWGPVHHWPLLGMMPREKKYSQPRT
jgi:hypothetical protein